MPDIQERFRRALSSAGYDGEARDMVFVFLQEYPRTFYIPHIEDYVHEDGTVEKLLKIKGVIKIYYRHDEFKLPAYMWLPKNFPQSPPIVYMDPTNTMERNPQCPHIDPNLRVNADSLTCWEYPLSNLEKMYEELQEIFSRSPPLCRKRMRHSSRTANHMPSTSQPIQAQSPVSSTSVHSDGWERPQQLGEEAAVSSMRNSLAIRLQSALEQCGKVDFDEQMLKHEDLVSKSEVLTENINTLIRSRQTLEDCISEFSRTNSKLESWLRSEEHKSKEMKQAFLGRSDPYDAIVAADPMFGDTLEANACIQAAQDSIARLDFALKDGKVTWEEYKKSLCTLSRNKFQAMIFKQKKESRNSAVQRANANAPTRRGEPSQGSISYRPSPSYPSIQGMRGRGHEFVSHAQIDESLVNPIVDATKRMHIDKRG